MQNRDMAQVIAQRDDSIHCKQQQLEDRARECSILSKQLEQVLEDAQRQVCRLAHTLLSVSFLGRFWTKGFTLTVLFFFQVGESHERALSKERSSQSKSLDLESQLGMSRAELSHLRRNKEDVSFVPIFYI